MDRYPLVNPVDRNHPADTPTKPSGPTFGKPGVKYTYSSKTTDIDGDQIYYRWDWGDGSFSDWLGPYPSGGEVTASYSWSNGKYKIKVKAKDAMDAMSAWSEPLLVIIEDEPPAIKIIKPEKALYLFNFKIRDFLINRKPLIIGKINITVDSSDDDSGVMKVEFYIDNDLRASDTDEPYYFIWKEKRLFRHRHIIKVVAYDNAGNIASDKILVRKFF